ncbi:MAG: ATP-binding protein, partial [Cyclobacteriaceae bacterium]
FDTDDPDRLPDVLIKQELNLPENTFLLHLNGQVRFVNKNGLYVLDNEELKELQGGDFYQQKPDRVVYTDNLSNDRCLVCYEDDMNSFYCEKFRYDSGNQLVSTGEYIYTEYKPTSIFQDTLSGDIWVGGAAGLKIFQSRETVKNSVEGKTLIREVKVNNDSIIYLGLEKELQFHHKENDIRVSFISRAPLSSGKVLYQYRLSGIQDRWSDWSAETSTRFSDLSPGDYLFEVRSSSPYVGQTSAAVLNFRIQKPWYTTFWAYLLYTLLVVMLIFILYRLRVKNLIRKQEELSEKVLQTTAQLARANASLHDKNIALRKLDQFKSRFFANISHDLRTPIMLLSGRVDMLKSDYDSFLSEKGKGYLEKLEQDSKKLVAMTDEIQELVKIEEGKLELDYKNVTVKPFFERIVGLFDSAAASGNISLFFISDVDTRLSVAFDPHYIERVMYNLIANALKFTLADGTVTVSIAKNDENLIISVKDDGIGIPKGEIAEIFNRNFQADNQQGMTEGLGIGLNLVKEIVGLHKGKVRVANNEDSGAEFVVELPLQTEVEASSFQMGTVGEFISTRDFALRPPEIVESSIIPANISDAGSHKKKLLLVEDNPAVRAYMKEIVELRYDVYLSSNGREALVVLGSYKIDLIITDLMMPVMDGFEFLNGIKERYEYQDIPVLVVSARDSQEDKYKIMKLGVSNILAKPFDRNEFLLQIQNLLNSREGSVTLKMITEHVGEQNASQLSKLNELIFENISDFNFKIGHLAEKFHLSERSFFRMIKNITGKSPLEYVKDVKFRYAFDLLKKKKVRSLKEASLAIGMKNTSDFNKQFQKRFGVKADTILKNH